MEKQRFCMRLRKANGKWIMHKSRLDIKQHEYLWYVQSVCECVYNSAEMKNWNMNSIIIVVKPITWSLYTKYAFKYVNCELWIIFASYRMHEMARVWYAYEHGTCKFISKLYSKWLFVLICSFFHRKWPQKRVLPFIPIRCASMFEQI